MNGKISDISFTQMSLIFTPYTARKVQGKVQVIYLNFKRSFCGKS